MKHMSEKIKRFTAMFLAITMVMSGNVSALAGTLPEELQPREPLMQETLQQGLPEEESPEGALFESAGITEPEEAEISEEEVLAADVSVEEVLAVEESEADPMGEGSASEELPGTENAVLFGARPAGAEEEHALNGYFEVDYQPALSVYGMAEQTKAKGAKSGELSLQKASELPAAYSSADEGYISPIKNQGRRNNCWAFTYTEAAESEIMASGAGTDVEYSSLGTTYFFYNLPQDPLGLVGPNTKNKLQASGTNWLDFGGNILLTSFTLSAWTGVFNEADIPWSQADPSAEFDYEDYDLQAVQTASYYIHIGDMEGIKRAIMKYGSVEMGFWGNELNGIDSGIEYSRVIKTHDADGNWINDLFAYRKTDVTSNHAVQIVGWDDTLPADAFTMYKLNNGEYTPTGKPSKDGGWLVRNTWGDMWPEAGVSHPGCFWISYEDGTIDYTMVAVDMEPSDTYLNNYHYDATASYNMAVTAKQVGNVFRAQHTEEISAVSVGIKSPGATMTVDLYVSDTPFDGSPIKGDPVRRQSQRIEYDGLQFVELEEPLTVETGQYFSVVASTPGESQFHVDKDGDSVFNNDLYFTTDITSGQCYYLDKEGKVFKDEASANMRCKNRIKAFTKKIAGNLNLTVGVNDWAEEGTDYPISVSGDYTDDDVTFTYSDAEDGEYSAEKPKTAGTWWVKATARETRWQMGTEVKKSYKVGPPCVITWKLENGAPDDVDRLMPGQLPSHADPVKEKTVEYIYTFSHWTPALTPATGDVTYTAVYVATPRTYTVQWMNGKSRLETDTAVPYGETPVYNGKTPEKEPTDTLCYEFAGWSLKTDEEDLSPDCVITPGPVTMDTVYYAKFRAVPRTYTVTWKNGDTDLATQSGYHYLETADFRKDDPARPLPTRASTAEYDYEFIGWSLVPDSAVTQEHPIADPIIVDGDLVCFARFREQKRKYKIDWKNDDGTLLESDETYYGVLPEYNGAKPVKKPTETLLFELKDNDWWTPAVAPVTRAVTYTAKYVAKTRYYTVRWIVGETETARQTDYQYLQCATYQRDDPEREDPVREPTAKYEYEFAGWSEVSEAVDPSPESVITPGPVKKDTVYYAKFRATVRKYSVTWKNADGTVLETDQTEYGKKPGYDGKTPEKKSTVALEFIFQGWTPDVTEVTGEAVYTAVYREVPRKYTVAWKNEDGTVLETDQTEYGKMPVYDGKTPVKAETKDYTYTFASWKPKVTKVTGTAVYTASFTAKKKGGGGGGGAAPKLQQTGATFSRFWYVDASGVWRIRNKQGQNVTSAWLCDDAVTVNGQNVWYLLNADGTMLAAGLVCDNTGNFYSLETNHDGYFGMLRYKNGTYNCNGHQIYLEFSQKHDGTFGAVINPEAIQALTAIYGVTRFGIGNDACVYTKTFE